MTNSRRIKTIEKKSIRNTIFAILGIFIIFSLIIIFGMQFIINLSLGLEKITGNNNPQTTTSTSPSYISPPHINPMSPATNSAHIIVSGVADKDQTINLYVNGKLSDKTKTKDDKSFSFKDITLDQGQNDIKAKAVGQNNNESDYSQNIQVTYSSEAPKLDVNTPQDGQTYGSSPITVSGTTEPNNRVTVNDFWAIVDDSGKFSYMLPLQKGENTLIITSINEAGNKITKQIKVRLQ